MRRAAARSSLSGWANLQGAEEDYKSLLNSPGETTTVGSSGANNNPRNTLSPPDRAIVQKALRDLPARIQEARDREMGDMMGKLKELGNGILKPFGMSTEDFKMVKDEKTGGYSLSVGKGG